MVFKQGRFVLVVTITLSQQAAHVMMISVVQTCMVIGERILVSFSYDASYIISKLLFLFFYSATQSGLLLVPVDDNGVPVQGILHGSLWYHGTEAATCSIPSEQYSEFIAGGFSANILSTVLFAGYGTIGLAPDGLGEYNMHI